MCVYVLNHSLQLGLKQTWLVAFYTFPILSLSTFSHPMPFDLSPIAVVIYHVWLCVCVWSPIGGMCVCFPPIIVCWHVPDKQVAFVTTKTNGRHQWEFFCLNFTIWFEHNSFSVVFVVVVFNFIIMLFMARDYYGQTPSSSSSSSSMTSVHFNFIFGNYYLTN